LTSEHATSATSWDSSPSITSLRCWCLSGFRSLQAFSACFSTCDSGVRTRTWAPSQRVFPATKLPEASLDKNHPLRRSEEHTSELQSPCNLVCRLLLEKKKKIILQSAATPISRMLHLLPLSSTNKNLNAF